MSARSVLKGLAFSALGAAEGTRGSGARTLGTRNFLVLAHGAALGTAVHQTPLIPALRAVMPDARIAVAASGFGMEVFRNNPGVDRLIETPSPLRDVRGARSALQAGLPFGGERFAILAPVGNERTRVVLSTMFVGAERRFGFTEVPEVFRCALKFDRAESMIDNNLRIVGALGYPFRHFEPQMFFSDADLERMKALLVREGVREGQTVAVFVTQTSVTQKKGWRSERFQAVARFLMEQYGAHVLFVGTKGEREKIEELRVGLGGATSNVAGETNLMEMAALLSLCDVGVTLDTGTLHIGRTQGLPMVVIAPAWSPAIEWLPVGNPRYRILKNADMERCPEDYVIDEVSVDEVIVGVRDLLEEFPRR